MTKIADMSLLFFYSYDCIRYSSGDIADAIYELRLDCIGTERFLL